MGTLSSSLLIVATLTLCFLTGLATGYALLLRYRLRSRPKTGQPTRYGNPERYENWGDKIQDQ